MKVKIEKDSLDLEELKDCVRSRGYNHIAERQASMLDSLRNSLELERDPAGVRFIQGQIDALRTCMKLPQIIHDEIRAKQRKRPSLET